ncbi:MAG TPA: DUF885 domain-containing protein [Thermoanaerobaculia bacterium]|jgi:uncharacterized protein (DUF885 family)
MRRLALLLALTALACTTTKPTPDTVAGLAEEQWQHQLLSDAGARASLGLPIEHLPDVTFANTQREADFARGMLARIERIDATQLTEDDRITLDVLRHRQQHAIDEPRWYWHTFLVTPYATPIVGIDTILGARPLRTQSDLDNYLHLLDEYALFIDRIAGVVREQEQRGIRVPKLELPAVRATLASLRGVSLVPDEARLAAIDGAARDTFLATARQKAQTKIEPAFAHLVDLFSPAYESAAPERVGVMNQPGGAEAYRALIRLQTTLDLDPDEVHALGLREVERIEGEMAKVREQLGFRGTSADFRQFVRSDPRFFGKSADEIGQRLGAYVKKIEPHIDAYFATKPRAPYDVRRLDPNLEGSMTFGYYQQPTASDPAGHYFYNGSKPDQRSMLSAASLMLHELVPGHHFQINRQLENASLPRFRSRSFDNVFIEGWGEYAATLGWEMGLFDDPYDRYGRLMIEMMMACRLVVDTGMNAKGWTREQAIDFLRAHTLLSETELATETLRYSVDIPAQALAYKIGSLRMLELRRRAEQQLGSRFDVRAFHEWMIGSGSMPLPALEAHIERMIAQAK